MGPRFEENKIYIARAKKNFCDVIKRGEYYRCIKKGYFGGTLWHTNQDNDDFGFSWNWSDWYETFEKPIEIMTSKDFKVGEEYLCVEDFYFCTGGIDFVKNKTYKVIRILGKKVTFIDESKHNHSMNDNYLSYFIKSSQKEIKYRDIKVGDVVYIKEYKDVRDHYGIYPKTWDNFIDSPLIIEEVDLKEGIIFAGGFFWPMDAISKHIPKNKEKDFQKFEKTVGNVYIFRDDEISWEQVCNDMIKDKKNCFYIEGKDCDYVGIFDSPFTSDFTCKGFSILEFPKNKKEKCLITLKKLSLSIEKEKANLDNWIKNRYREKRSPKTYKVHTF
jgi:hypothetical protein